MTFGESTLPIDWPLTVGRRRTRQAAFIDGVVHRGGYDPPTLLAALGP